MHGQKGKVIWRDPRSYQIAVLAALLLHGICGLDFELTVSRVVITVATAVLTQWTCTRLWRLPAFDPRSALISALSLCLLLRTSSAALTAAAAILTIASKFVIRVNGKHLFNPTNFGLVSMMLLDLDVWVSPGQWGASVVLGFFLLCLGGLVVNRASRSDVTYAFLAFYVTLVLVRASWLGDPLSIPFHQLENGAFLLFTFFMISDPKTTPNSRAGRILFALLVALGAGFVHFVLYRPNGLLWSLAGFSLTVPLIDCLLPATPYRWPTTERLPTPARVAERRYA